MRCRHCGLAYRSPRPTEEYLTQYFEEEWTEPLTLESARANIFKEVSKWVLESHPLPGNILDIGSGNGNLLAQFPQRWKLFGVEPSKDICHSAEKHLPRANIINKTLDRINFPHEYFDVITVIGTIYYLHQPLRDLAHVRKLLKSNGISLIESPNFSNKGYIYRWKNHHFTKTWVYFYTPKSMEKIINLVGMEVVDRIDLPGHRASIGNFSGRIISWIELYITIIIRKISFGMIDIVPRFVLVAVRKNSQSKDGC